MPVYALQQTENYIEPEEIREQRRQNISREIDAFTDIALRNKLKKFLVAAGVGSIEEMDYPLRQEYETFLAGEISKNNIRAYLNAYDTIRRHFIGEQMKTLAGRQKYQWQYRNQILYLPYHPDRKVAETFADSRQRQILVWDFTKHCSEQLKRQIFVALNCVIETYTERNTKRNRLLALQYLYDFCAGNGVRDIEILEMAQIEKYQSSLRQKYKGKKIPTAYEHIIGIARKAVFLDAEEIHWQANIWYLERFHISERRRDSSKSLESVSFLEIANRENRKYAQEYMKYELGITGQALSTVTGRYRFVRNFLIDIDKNVCQCTHEDIENYIKKLQENGLAAKGFNERLSGIRHFFKFLEVRGDIKNVPFRAEYYWKKELPVHHDRSVEYEVYMEIIQKLHLFPEHLRCMFLHLWCIGLRASEVCILKGNAYYRQGEDAWIQVYQVKMKTYKRVPIPEGLYRIMQVYLKKNRIGSEEYIFKDSRNGACKYQTFRHQMIKFCKKNGIAGGNYIFQSHDYRHTVATMFYDNEVSIQSIRDYLGHAYEEMTQQYIDYMPRKLAEANEEYFNAPEHDLASSLRKGENDG